MTYQIINDILKDEGSDLTAAEAHGIATGILCVDSGAAEEQWILDIFEGDFPVENKKRVLTALFNQTRTLLSNEEYAFDLFLPDDEKALAERVESLREWCQGFLYGVGYASSPKEIEGSESTKATGSDWPGEIGEILKDVVEFTKLNSHDDIGHSEEIEAAYTEINEYLRVAVLLIRNELSTPSDFVH